MNSYPVHPALLNEGLWGFLAGCAFVAGVASVAFFLFWFA